MHTQFEFLASKSEILESLKYFVCFDLKMIPIHLFKYIYKYPKHFNKYSSGKIKMPSYEAIYVIPPMFEGQYRQSSSMDFQVMGHI